MVAAMAEAVASDMLLVKEMEAPEGEVVVVVVGAAAATESDPNR